MIQPISANGILSSPYCFAFSLLACLTAYLEYQVSIDTYQSTLN